jgi:YVTN family beta-propeller protein
MVARRLFLGLCFLPAITLLAPASPEEERPRYKSPLGLAVDPTGKLACVALHTSDALALVDLIKYRVVCEIPVGRKPYDVALHKGIAYVTCEADDTLVAVDVAARKVTQTFKVGQAPRGVAVDPTTGLIRVVCHDAKVLWTQDAKGQSRKIPIPPQPEGNYARASNFELVLGAQATYRVGPRPFNLFLPGQSVFEPRQAAGGPNQPAPPSSPPQPGRTAFNPTLDLDLGRNGMDLVAHTRPRWFTPTVSAQDGRVFTNAFSFFLNTSTPAAVVLLDEPDKGYPDPTDVVVKLPKQVKKANPAKLAPLTPNSSSANHPLKGSRVFISSGGADTVIAIDFDKAAQHFEANRLAGFNGLSGGFPGGISGFNGGNFGGIPGGSGTLPVPGQFSGISSIAFPGGGGSTVPIGGPPSKPGTPPVPATTFPPARAGGPGMTMSGGFGGGFNGGWNGGFNGGGLGGWQGGISGFNGFNGNFGWMGGFGGFREDLHASAAYTIARLPTQANPRRMVLTPDAKTLIVSNHLADSLTLIDTENLKVLRHIDLGGPRPDEARRGEIVFHSAKFTFQQQFTCASCHPNQGSDGLSWNTSPDGKGEHLNTRALQGVRDTMPFGWRGESETLQGRAKNTMRDVHKHQLSDAAASAIAAYLETLDPPRPLPRDPKDAPAIARGAALFNGKGNCKSCHRGPEYTSESPRAVIQDHHQKWTPFDVPSLRGVGRTAPYLHDGRAATLEEIFLIHNPQKRHGRAHELTRPELNDLITFLKSI